MRQKQALRRFCNSLDGLQGSLLLYEEGLAEFLFSAGYPRYYEEVEALRNGLEDIGLHEELPNAIRKSEELAKAGKYEEASDIVLEINRKLSELSGANEALRRIYTAANDPPERKN